MCESCLAEAKLIAGKCIGSLNLVQATKDTAHWKAGEYGLLIADGPLITWHDKPVTDPIDEMGDDDKITSEEEKQSDQHGKVALQIQESMMLHIHAATVIVAEAIEEGYRYYEDGFIHYWIVTKLAKAIERAEVTEKLMPHPDWTKAPKDALAWAVDSTGWCLWWKETPKWISLLGEWFPLSSRTRDGYYLDRKIQEDDLEALRAAKADFSATLSLNPSISKDEKRP